MNYVMATFIRYPSTPNPWTYANVRGFFFILLLALIVFLKRLRWGGLTVGELREVTHRIRELEQTKAKNTNILSGKIVDVKG